MSSNSFPARPATTAWGPETQTYFDEVDATRAPRRDAQGRTINNEDYSPVSFPLKGWFNPPNGMPPLRTTNPPPPQLYASPYLDSTDLPDGEFAESETESESVGYGIGFIVK